ncbi:MAG: STAS domain-containing protein [Spirochaetes bacterium]|nr:STAS domain-containing protein [Spirochaetota bacterium]MBN2769810.1 STAS domain-containing protein [Spirochaetota bacterium]
MIIIKNNRCFFPDRITFEQIPELYMMSDQLVEENIVLDLSSTHYIHSAFIGFLIFLKNEKEKKSKPFSFISSEWLESLLIRLQLNNFFNSRVTNERISA